MKKIIITSALLLITAASFAQAKTAPTKPQYIKGYFILTDDLNALLQLANERKQAVIYESNFEPTQAVNYQKQIDAYLKELGKRVKLDSVKVDAK